MEREIRSGYAVAVIFILAVVGAVWAFGNFDAASSAAQQSAVASASSSTPAPTPAELPAEVVFGAALDGDSGQVADAQFHFQAGESMAFSAWLGQPAGVGQVLASVLRLEADGFTQVGDPLPIAIDPQALVISGTLETATLLDGLGPGTYLLDVRLPSGDQLGYGTFQLEVAEPESVEYFLHGPQQVLISAGKRTGEQFDDAGTVVGQKESTLARDSSAPATFRAIYNGQQYLFISRGIWAGFFLPESEGVVLGR